MTECMSSTIITSTAEYLVSALPAGDVFVMNEAEQSFETLVKNYEPLIKKLIMQLNVYANHDEFYQIGLIALWEASLKFDQTKGYFPPFAQKYMKGRMLQLLDKQKKHQTHHVYVENDQQLDLAASCDDYFHFAELDSLLAILSPREQIWLRAYLEGRKPKEIATVEDVSVETVKSWRKTALRKLKRDYGV